MNPPAQELNNQISQHNAFVLDKYGVGAISIGSTDLRMPFSCIAEQDIQELFDTIYAGVKDLS